MFRLITILLLFALVNCTNQEVGNNSTPAGKRSIASAKSKTYMEINFATQEIGPEQLYLRADIKALQDFMNAQIEWKLPENAELVAGEKLWNTNLPKGTQMSVGINLVKASLNEGDRFTLVISKDLNGEKHGTSRHWFYPTGEKTNIKAKSLPNTQSIQE